MSTLARRLGSRGFPVVALVSLILLMVASAVVAQTDGDPAAVRERNAAGRSYETSDRFSRTLTPEMRANMLGFAPPPGYDEELARHLKILPVQKALPLRLDWRDVEGITPVTNQMQCGSCWAFAATAEMEAFVKIYYGVELDLSEQQVVSCNPYGAGCDGGWASAAYYVFQNYGAVLESCNPYVAAEPPCAQDPYKRYAFIDGWRSIANDEEQIKTALQDGPVCTGIDGAGTLEDYASGCYDEPGYSVNHLVLIVGYDDRACGGNGAWIIKNSWGTDFGVGGYATVQYGAALTGRSVTQLDYTPPPVNIVVDGTLGSEPLFADQPRELTWNTSGSAAATVDIWLGVDGECHEILIAQDVPNTGSTFWSPPNVGTDWASLMIVADGDPQQGFGKSAEIFQIVGHKLRYVSPLGSNTAPYETPATAAHDLGDAVAACTGTDTVCVAGGDYSGSATINDPVHVQGGWNSDFTQRDPDQWPTRLQGNGTALRFFSGAGDFCGVEGITFHDGLGSTFSSPVGGRHGGAIYSLDASPVIRDCRFEDNRGDPAGGTAYGGAVCLIGGSPVVEDCLFTGNVGSRGGAVGIFGGASATLRNNTFQGNTCSDLGGEENLGAALCVENATCLVEGGTFDGNGNVGRGGAAAVVTGTLDLVDVVLSTNNAQEGGGAVYAQGSTIGLRGVLIRDNTVAGGGGGGFELDDAVVDLRNTRFRGNTASASGGAIWGFGMSGVMENCLFDGNIAPSVGGVAVFAQGPAVFRNSIVTGNQGGGMMFGGAEATADYNNVWGNVGGDYVSMTAGPNDVSLDPLFQSADACQLLAMSPCIDRGDPGTACNDPDGSRSDLGVHGGPDAVTAAPERVTGAALTDEGANQWRLDWDASSAGDLQHYLVYRDTASSFVPQPANLVAQVTATTWTDTGPAAGSYYLVQAVDTDNLGGGYSDAVLLGGSGISAVDGDPLPQRLAISGVVPNPFNPQATIRYDVHKSGPVRLEVFDLRGRLVRQLVSAHRDRGSFEAVWNGRDGRGAQVATGIYFARLKAGEATVTTKMVLAK